MIRKIWREWSVYLRQPVLPSHRARRRYPWMRKITALSILSALALSLVTWGYVQLLARYGTISPLFTLIFTKAFHGRRAADYPPTLEDGSAWRPDFRVVVSLTTTPDRLATVMHSVTSLLHQSLVPDQIYVNVPRGRMKRHPERLYDDVEIPVQLSQVEPLVKVNRCVDDGPATKLLGALRLEDDPDTLIITVDDDFEYPSQLVEALAWESVYQPEVAVGVCGWGMMPLPGHPAGVVPAYVPYFLRPQGRVVDILQACCGNAYRRRFFSDVNALASIPSSCITVDDVWIAGYLKMVEGRETAIVSKRLDPTDTPWKHAEAKSEKKKMTLSYYNHKNQMHYKCVQVMEQRYRRRWRRNYET